MIAWKRMVQGVREMCDVCETNLFNYHWACGRCGFVVCVDCYHDRKDNHIRTWPNTQHSEGENNGGNSNGESSGNNSSADGTTKEALNKYDQKDKFNWLLCTNKTQHELDKLMLTQIITGDTLEKVYDKLKSYQPETTSNVIKEESKDNLGNVDVNKVEKDAKSTPNSDEKDLTNESDKDIKVQDNITAKEDSSSSDKSKSCHLQHYIRQSETDYVWNGSHRLPKKSFSLVETKSTYSGVGHTWLCEGFVPRIDANTIDVNQTQVDKTVSLFKEVWRRGQPVVFSDVYRKMDLSLWAPNRLAEEFGDIRTEFVDAVSGVNLGNHLLRKFFEGFSVTSRRTVKNKNGKSAIVRLSDWPPSGGEEFINALPAHAADFQQALPLPMYTNNKEVGFLNLSASLPDVFMRPDVGPRAMLIYGPGGGEDGEKAAFDAVVNLSIETSDTLSLLVHAEVPRDLDRDSFRKDVIKFLESSNCDVASCRRVGDAKELPGILWQVFHPSDADKVKDLLNKNAVAKEKTNNKKCSKQPKPTKKRNGRKANADVSTYSESSDYTTDSDKKVDKNFDMIQEETHHLDTNDILTLKKEYGVTPFVIAQFPGEAVVLPAGAPYQVSYDKILD